MPAPPEVARPSQPSAIAMLQHCFAQPLEHARTRHAAGERVVGTVSHVVPWEILRAAGLSPVVVRPTTPPAGFCDEFIEPGVFSPRIRTLFESTLAGDLGFLSALVFSRSSEQEYKAYLYLREAIREGRDGIPPLVFYDLLYSSSAHAREYGLARTRDLSAVLESVAGRAIREDDLEAAVHESNAARSAVRRVLALRRNAPRISGVEALALTGPFFLIDRGTYATLANRAADEAEGRPPLAGPRLALAGASLDDSRLHALVEAHGAVVVAEDGGWGSRAAGHDIEHGDDLVPAIFEKYYRDGPSVRQWPPADRAWVSKLDAGDVDGVVVYLPPEDSVLGWDVPHERRRLDERGLPSLVIRGDVDDAGATARWHEPIAAFVHRLGREH